MNLRPTSYDSVKVVVRFRGDCYHARAGSGKLATLASSTSSFWAAAEAAAKKFFGGGEVALDLAGVGSITLQIPQTYLARRLLP
ncbi:MAG: hypothetical protein FJ399_00475 [Verrucomicrobia bacterium]|nr:hypothetical protein [Verrucomicrobiota bacterium]